MKYVRDLKFEHIIIVCLLIILTIVIFVFKENEKVVDVILSTFTNIIVFATSKLYDSKEIINKSKK
ncbi:hypothetical protein ACER0A_007240 [Haloimpatiens sp. FM7315]|uniref:hypothetical protein n=1 Tax=Haloimpatiens sp. FM7315 TaxID=3298609 RepID=UPI0035A3C746